MMPHDLNKKIKLLKIDDRYTFLKSSLQSIIEGARWEFERVERDKLLGFNKAINSNLMAHLLSLDLSQIDFYGVEKIAILNKTQHTSSYHWVENSGKKELALINEKAVLIQWFNFLELVRLEEKIEYLLKLEHKEKLPTQYLGKKYRCDTVKLTDIIYSRDRINQIEGKKQSSPHIYPLSCPLILEELVGSEKLRLIDGYHRMSEIDKSDIKTINAYIALRK